MVCIVGEPKTPDALRNASDQFFEWEPENTTEAEQPDAYVTQAKADQTKPQIIKRRPKFVVDAVALLADSTSEGQVHLAALGQYLKRTDPGFSPTNFGHSGLLDMLKTYDLLALKKAEGGHYTVGLSNQSVCDAEGKAEDQ